MASNSTERQESGGSASPCGKLRVLFLASEWGSSEGGLSTTNRELAINTAQHSGVDVTIFVPQCNDEDKKAALGHKIKLVEATRQPGVEKLQWLFFLPDDLHIDVVVGHGIMLGPQANAIKKAQKCKWVQVVHTVPEELAMYKTLGADEKHKIEVELCQLADFVVSIGPKLNEAFRCYLSSCKNAEMFFNFTPGIFSEFSEVKQVSEREGKFRVLLFGRGDEEDFSVKGFDIAAKAVASLENTKLVFVGAPEREVEEVKDRFLNCGIRASNLTVRSFSPDRESLKRLFCEVDLAVMPSRTEGFGLTALEALSAGLPILVSENSGFGEALSKVRFGSYFVVDSDDAQVWANAIQRLQVKERCDRLEESEILRSLYSKKYGWKKQCGELISKMTALVEGSSTERQSAKFKKVSQQTEIASARHPGTVELLIELESATYKDDQHADLKGLMKEMANQFFDTIADDIPTKSIPFGLRCYLEGALRVKVTKAVEGSLRITVECPTLEILEGLWEDYSSGHLNEVAEENLLTDDIKRRLHVKSIALKTIILEEDYLVCKQFLKGSSTQCQKLTHQETLQQTDDTSEFHSAEEILNKRKVDDRENVDDDDRDQAPPAKIHNTADESSTLSKDSLRYGLSLQSVSSHLQHWDDGRGSKVIPSTAKPLVKERVNVLQDYTQTADKTQSESVKECEPVTLHFSVNGKGKLANLQQRRVQEKDGNLVTFPEELTNKGDVGRSVGEIPAYLERVKLIQDSRQTNESVNLIRVAVECENPEILEQLWQDYRSGHLNVVAEKCLVTDDIKRRFHLKSVKFKTTILEEDYLACKDFLLNNTESDQRRLERQVFSPPPNQAANETRTLCIKEEGQGQKSSSSIHIMNSVAQSSQGETPTKTLQIAQAYVTDEKTNGDVVDDTGFQSVEGEISTVTSDDAREYSSRTQPSEDIVVLSVEDMTQIANETPRRKYVSAEAVETQAIDETHSQSAEERNTQDVETIQSQPAGRQRTPENCETQSQSAEEQNTQIGGEIQCQSADRQRNRSISDAQGQHTQGQRSQGNRIESLEELRPNVLNDIYSKCSKGINPWIPFAKEITDQAVDKPVNTESFICGFMHPFSVSFVYTNARETNLDLGGSRISDQGIQYLSEALKASNTVTNLDLSCNGIGCQGVQYLSKALKVNKRVATLDLSCNSIDCEGVQYLSEALKVNNTVTKLDLSGNSIACLGAQHISEVLKVNNTVTNLDLSWSNIGSLGVQYLSEALKVNNPVTDLDLEGNTIGIDGAHYLSEALKGNNTVTNLNLSRSSIGTLGTKYLSEALEVNKTLTNLDLSWSSIGSLGAQYLSDALKVNNTVTSLDLSWSSIGSVGAQYLSEALKVNKTVTDLDLSWSSIGVLGAQYLSGALNGYNVVTNLDLIGINISKRGGENLSESLELSSAVTKLDLSGNNISYHGAQYLSEALKANNVLANLELFGNSIGDFGALSLSRALRVSTTVTNLGLSWNDIGSDGAQCLSETLKVNNTVTNVDLSWNSIGDHGVKYLSEALKVNNTVINLDLSGNSIGSVGAQYVSESLKVNNTVTFLALKGNNIGVDGVQCLSEAVKVNNAMTHLDLSWSSIGKVGAHYLFENLKANSTVTKLDLTGNNICDTGAHYLSDALKVNNTVANLDLSWNSIGDRGARHLSDALKVNNSVANLDLSWNSIGDQGAQYFSEVLKVNGTVNNLDFSGNSIGRLGAQYLSDALMVNKTVTNVDLSKNDNSNLDAHDLPVAMSFTLQSFNDKDQHEKLFNYQKEGDILSDEDKPVPQYVIIRKNIGITKRKKRFPAPPTHATKSDTFSGKTGSGPVISTLFSGTPVNLAAARNARRFFSGLPRTLFEQQSKGKRRHDSSTDDNESPEKKKHRKKIGLQKQKEKYTATPPHRILKARSVSRTV